jgi:acyl-CoA thioesterase II
VTSISPRSSEPGDAGEPAGYSEHLTADAAFLGMDRLGGTNRFEFTVTDHLSRLDGKLYGGTAIAASVAAAEQVSDRPALWMTTQFVSTTGLDSKISVQVEVLAPGRRTHQVSVTGTDAQGQVIFASLGATGHHAPDGLTGEFESRPEVGSPESGEVWSSPFIGMARGAGIDPSVLPLPAGVGFSRAVDLRHPEILRHPDPGPGRVCVWARRTDGGPVTAAVAAYLADMVPMAVARAHGVVAMGTSLDNTIRIGTYVQSEWVLIDLRPHLAAGGYGHGIAHVWSETGQLMATASQTASMRPFDPDNLPWV